MEEKKMGKKLKGLLVSPNSDQPEVVEVEDSLEAFYDVLGCGMVEHLRCFGDHWIVALFDEYGKIDFKTPNILLITDGKIYDYIAGEVLFVYSNFEGEFLSLPDDVLERLKVKFGGEKHYVTYGE